MGLEHFRLDHPAGDDEVAAEADEMAAIAAGGVVRADDGGQCGEGGPVLGDDREEIPRQHEAVLGRVAADRHEPMANCHPHAMLAVAPLIEGEGRILDQAHRVVGLQPGN